jgi:hydrogenase nickel incorporation protein HypA/HybF
MHEMALTESIVQAIEEGAGQHGYSTVTGVWVEVGALAGVEVEALRFCFDAVARGTLAEGARFEIVATTGEAWCVPCGKTVAIAQKFAPCPECGGHQLQITGGEELRITELEVH